MKNNRRGPSLIGNKRISSTRISPAIQDDIESYYLPEDEPEEKKKIVQCLSCDKNFRPRTKFNKVCDVCKKTEAWRHGQ